MSSGTEISPYYDSMFAKIIAHGRDRDEARLRLAAALTNTVVFGVKTNKALLTRCLEHPLFARGAVGTGFLEACRTDIFREVADAQPFTVALAAAALCAHGNHHQSTAMSRQRALIHLRDALTGTVTVASVVQTAASGYKVTLPDQTVDLAVTNIGEGVLGCVSAGVSSVVPYHRHDNGIELQMGGQVHSFEDITYAPATATAGDGASDGRVRAAMTGRVAAVFVAPGSVIRKGDDLLTLEAMKMEHRLCAPADGIVSGVTVARGDQVAAGKLLVEMTLDVLTPA